MRLPHFSKRPRNATWLVYLRVAFTFASVFLFAPRLAAHWPPKSESDGVYGRFSGNTDLSLKLGGLISDSRLAGSVGASAHYYSLIGVTGDYSESLVADAEHTRSFSLGAELRPLFLPRWALGLERGPAWLDLTLDSTCVGFGAYFADAGTEQEDTRGVWLSFGVGAPVLGQAAGPWLELRLVRRFPDHDALGGEARNAMMFYLSWHHVMQVSQGD
jgi:hypothetical protein